MTNLVDLPRELRQKILLAAMQQEAWLIGSTWPRTLTALLHVCTLLRHDMPWVLTSWNPEWHLQTPLDCCSRASSIIAGIAYNPQPHRLRIHIFHEVLVETIKEADWAMVHPSRLHYELVAAWSNAVPQLPADIETVSLDVTPAPGWTRQGSHMYQLRVLVCDNRVARSFMNVHIEGIARLVQRIRGRYGGDIPIELTGMLGPKSKNFVDGVVGACGAAGIGVDWTGEYVVRGQDLQFAVQRLAPKHRTPRLDADEWKQALRLARLRKVGWSKKSIGLFGRVGEQYGIDAVTAELRDMAEVMVGDVDGELKLTPAGNLHRAMAHSLALDMRLRTESIGDGEQRHVVVTKP